MHKKIISTVAIGIIIGATSLTSYAQTNMNDIGGHWANKQIQNFINSGYINGYEDKTFKPDNSITRAEFIKIVNRYFGFESKSNINFRDVSQRDWFYNDVCIAKQAGYINGYEDGTFKPDKTITREEVAKILISIKHKKDFTYDKLQNFIDKNDVSEWAKPYVEGAIESKYINGNEKGELNPTKNITRAESVVMISRTDKKIGNHWDDDPVLVPPTNQAPRIEFKNVTLNQGEKFDNSMLNVKVNDPEDGVLTGDSIAISGNVDTSKAGKYNVTIKATDTQGCSNEVTATVEVKAVEVVKPVVKNTAPHIAGENVTLNQGEKFDYEMLKVDAIDKEDGVITENVKYEGNVDTNKPGVYIVKATVKDSKGLATTESFTVTVKAKEVVNNAPVINCVDTYTMSSGDKFDVEMIGATAHDQEDGDLTNQINMTGDVKDAIGTYHVTLSVTDSKGATTTKDVTVKVIKRNEAPVINVADTYTLTQGDKFDYSKLNASVTDDYDKDLTIQYKGNVNVNEPGEYRVSVYATDSKDMIGQKWVNVIVKAPVVKNEVPVLTATDVTLNQGEGFNIFMLNINAQDKEDGNITSKVHIVSNNLDTKTPGTYKVELSVSDKQGATATKTVTVTVKAK